MIPTNSFSTLPNFVNYLFYNTTPCQPSQSPVSCPCQWALWNITVSLFILLSISTGEKVCWTRKTWLIQSVYLERQIVWKCWWSVMVIVNKSTGLEVSWSFLQGCHDSCNDKLHSCHSCHVSSCHILHASRSTLSCTNWSYWWGRNSNREIYPYALNYQYWPVWLIPAEV